MAPMGDIITLLQRSRYILLDRRLLAQINHLLPAERVV
jgi:hypothetical protein